MRWTCLAAGLLLAAPLGRVQADGADGPDGPGAPVKPGLSVERAAEVTAALREAVEFPEPKQRHDAALGLLAKAGADVSVDSWLTVLREFGHFTAFSPGTAHETVPLWVGAGVEPFEVDLHLPQGYDPARPAPLLLALHGSGSDGASELQQWPPTADALGMIVVAPTDIGKNQGYTFGESERLAGWSAVRWARLRFNVDENRVYCSGSSRGGHMTWDLALRRPDVFAALAPFIGGPRLNLVGGQNNLRYMENLVSTPIRDLQGAKDDSGLVFNLHLAFDRLKALGAKDAALIEFADRAHDFDFSAVDWKAFLGGAVRDPRPSRVVRAATKAAEGRSHWVEITRVAPGILETFEAKQTSSEAKAWNAMTPEAKKKWMEHQAETRTARLDVRMDAPGKFTATGTGVLSFRLLLDDFMLPATGPVLVSWNGRALSKAVTRSAKPLLLDFVERLDRTFLPVAEVTVP